MARKDYTGYIKLEEKLDWAAMKKDLTCDDATGECIIGWSGETVPCLTAVVRGPKFEVKLKGLTGLSMTLCAPRDDTEALQ